jgi:hypothetical protein
MILNPIKRHLRHLTFSRTNVQVVCAAKFPIFTAGEGVLKEFVSPGDSRAKACVKKALK